MRLVIFDVDGTLTRTTTVAPSAMSRRQGGLISLLPNTALQPPDDCCARHPNWRGRFMKPQPSGSFMYMAARMHHFAMTVVPSEVEVHRTGPWSLTYVHREDDPSRGGSPWRP